MMADGRTFEQRQPSRPEKRGAGKPQEETRMTFKWWRGLLVGAALCTTASAAFAQNYPTKPIRIVVPYPPGGTADIMIRTIQDLVTASLGQQIVVDNRPGAAGVVGAREVARAAPDGYTLLFTNPGPSAVAPALQADPGYDPVADFAPVSLVSRAPLLLVVHPGFGAKDLAGLIQIAKEKPGTINYSSAGPGSFGHLSTELFVLAAGVKMVHVPYRGQAPALAAVLSGEVPMSLTSPSGSMNEYVKEGKLRLLGVSALQPSPLAPGAIPIATAIPGFEAEFWFGVTAPAKTSPEIVAKLNAAIVNALAKPDIQQKFLTYGAVAESSTPDEFARLTAAEAARWREVIKKANVQLD